MMLIVQLVSLAAIVASHLPLEVSREAKELDLLDTNREPVASLLPFPVQFRASAFSYNYVQAAIGQTEIDALGAEADTTAFALSLALGESVFLRASYQDSDVDPGADSAFELDLFRVGLGAISAASDSLHMYTLFSYIESSNSGSLSGLGALSAATDGYGAAAGARLRFAPRIELALEYEFIDFGSGGEDTGLSADLVFSVTEQVGLEVRYFSTDDSETILTGLRLYY